MEGIMLRSVLSTFVLTVYTPSVLAGIHCGNFYCPGINPECCTLSSGALGCCVDNYRITQTWWFWGVWVVFVLIIGFSALACWRRRRNQMRYVAMGNSQYPVYGTTIHASSHREVYPTGTFASPPGAGVLVKPPPYSYPPPAYSGQPPPYNA